MCYILVSAIKDEKENLSDLFYSVCNQTILPKLWVIVDDGSTDGSRQILDEVYSKKDFIHIISLKESSRDLLKVYRILSIGINLALELLENSDIAWKYLGILDGDIKLPSNYYEALINNLKKDSRIGIVSGRILSLDGKSYKDTNIDIDKPGNAARLITKRCYDLIGFAVSPAGDSIMNIHANNRGLKTLITNEVFAYQKRQTNSVLGYWKGYIYAGYLKYFMGCTPIYAILYAFKLLTTYPHLNSFPFIIGYFKALLKKKDKIDDTEVITYYKTILKNRIVHKFRKMSLAKIILV